MARPGYQRRPEDFKPGTLAPWPADKPPAAEVSQRVRYIASGEHKSYPSALWTVSTKAGKAKCPRIALADWPRLQILLQQAIVAGCVDQCFRGDFPQRVWAYINEVLYEARLSNAQQGEYHGFPLEYPEQFPADPHHQLRNAPRVTLAVD